MPDSQASAPEAEETAFSFDGTGFRASLSLRATTHSTPSPRTPAPQAPAAASHTAAAPAPPAPAPAARPAAIAAPAPRPGWPTV